MIIFGSIAALLIVVIIIGAAARSNTSNGNEGRAAASSATHPVSASPAAAPAPAPNPKGNITGSCDVSLSDSLYGQNYLTANVTATNTGNIGTIVRIKVAWPLQGFPSITKVKKVHTTAGSTRQVEFRAPVSQSQVSQFQDMQLAASGGDPCHYSAAIVGTFGSVQG